MTDRRWVTTSFPRRASLDAARPEPAAYLAGQLRQALRHGMPAARRGGPVLAWVGRRGLPTSPLAAALRRLPTRAQPELDAVLAQVELAWPELSGRSARLPAAPPPLTALAVQRSAAWTVFVFGRGPHPLLVVKQPGASGAGVAAEAAALRAVEPADVSPRLLGELAGAPVQEGLPGVPLLVEPVTPATARALGRSPALDELADALVRLAGTTVHRADLGPQLHGPLEKALAGGVLSSSAERRVAAARTDLADLDLSVLQHGDLSAQNWLADGQRFVGLVDWETAVPDGVPGFDVLHAAVSVLEHGVGLVRWSGARVETSFAAAWEGSGRMTGAREGFRRVAGAAGVPEDRHDALELAFFGRRLGRRLASPGSYAVGVGPTAAAVERVSRA